MSISVACYLILMFFCRLINAHCFATDFMLLKKIIKCLFLAINIINLNCKASVSEKNSTNKRIKLHWEKTQKAILLLHFLIKLHFLSNFTLIKEEEKLLFKISTDFWKKRDTREKGEINSQLKKKAFHMLLLLNFISFMAKRFVIVCFSFKRINLHRNGVQKQKVNDKC